MSEEHYIHSFAEYSEQFLKILIDYSPKLVAAVLMLVLGIWLIKIVNKLAHKMMVKRAFEPTLINFSLDILYWGLRFILFIAVISKLGVESSSFVAILGAAGLAIGLSLQGSLSNFAGGVLIILFKPFKLGDTIEAQGNIGTVIDIQIFTTKLITANNQVISIPNGILSNGVIINYSERGTRRTDLTLGISYETNIKKAKEIITEIIDQNPKILKEPAPAIVVKELTDSGIKIAIRVWSHNEDFFEVSSDILEDCNTFFKEKNIEFQPYVREANKK